MKNVGKILVFLMVLLVGSLLVFMLSNINPRLTGLTVINDLTGNTIAIEQVINSVEITDEFPNVVEKHWDHMPLTYNYDSECSTIFQGKMKNDIDNAMIFISDRTDNVVSFEKVDSDADISFICDIGGVRIGGYNKGFSTSSEAIPYLYNGTNVYAKGEIHIYATYDCLSQRPTMLIHETLHLLGLSHNVNPSHSGDILHPYTNDDCEADILDKDIEYLKNIYSK